MYCSIAQAALPSTQASGTRISTTKTTSWHAKKRTIHVFRKKDYNCRMQGPASYNDSCAALHYFPINRETFDISSSYWVALRCICQENISINVIIKIIDFKISFCIYWRIFTLGLVTNRDHPNLLLHSLVFFKAFWGRIKNLWPVSSPPPPPSTPGTKYNIYQFLNAANKLVLELKILLTLSSTRWHCSELLFRSLTCVNSSFHQPHINQLSFSFKQKGKNTFLATVRWTVPTKVWSVA